MTIEPIDTDMLADALAARHAGLPRELLSTYLGEIVNWNNRVALVSRRSTRSVLERLVDQSVGLWELIAKQRDAPPSSFVDVGTGAGFPGIIWKMMAPKGAGLLVERREKKATFLDRVVRVLGFSNLDVYSGDARDASRRPEWKGAFELATTLAVAAPEETIPLVRPLLAPGGVFATIVGSSTPAPDSAAGMLRICSEAYRGGAFVVYGDRG